LKTFPLNLLAELRDKVIATLNDRVSTRQRELQSEIERLGGVVSSEPRKASTARSKRAPKYRDGENVWSGVGSKPAWVVAKGDTLESYRV
jgi:DNA-binding protein H-NS